MNNKEKQMNFFRKVIEFPKNREYEQLQKNKQLEFGKLILDLIVTNGGDFSIVVDKETAEKIFRRADGKNFKTELIAVGTSSELNRKLNKDKISYSVFTGEGLD